MICVYSVTGKNSINENGEESFGLLCFAEIREFSGELHCEMEKVVLMDELPENWTYPLIQPKLIEKYLQIQKQSYSQIQQTAKQTIAYIKKIIKPGMKLFDIRKLCEEKLMELGADSFWYWDVGAFVFAGDETTVSVSGKQYATSDKIIENNDIITIDLSPQVGNIWGDYARTIIVENGEVVDDIELIQNQEWKSGLQMEDKLHAELFRFVTKGTTFEELYYHMNEFIVENGFVNLDFIGGIGGWFGGVIKGKKQSSMAVERKNQIYQPLLDEIKTYTTFDWSILINIKPDILKQVVCESYKFGLNEEIQNKCNYLYEVIQEYNNIKPVAVGVDLLPEKGHVILSDIKKIEFGKVVNKIVDVWLFEYDGEVDLSNATTDEVAQVAWMNREQIKELFEHNMFVETLEYFFTEVDK